eukprot:g6010.t1
MPYQDDQESGVEHRDLAAIGLLQLLNPCSNDVSSVSPPSLVSDGSSNSPDTSPNTLPDEQSSVPHNFEKKLESRYSAHVRPTALVPSSSSPLDLLPHNPNIQSLEATTSFARCEGRNGDIAYQPLSRTSQTAFAQPVSYSHNSISQQQQQQQQQDSFSSSSTIPLRTPSSSSHVDVYLTPPRERRRSLSAPNSAYSSPSNRSSMMAMSPSDRYNVNSSRPSSCPRSNSSTMGALGALSRLRNSAWTRGGLSGLGSIGSESELGNFNAVEQSTPTRKRRSKEERLSVTPKLKKRKPSPAKKNKMQRKPKMGDFPQFTNQFPFANNVNSAVVPVFTSSSQVSSAKDANLTVSNDKRFHRKSPSKQKNRDPNVIWCKCRKTACLKLYCRCFAAGIVCTDGMCTCGDDCANARLDDPRRLLAIESIKVRNNGTFHKTQRKGCRCRNSKCLKKYCVCYAGKVKCQAELCQCVDCANGLENHPRNGSVEARHQNMSIMTTAFPSQTQVQFQHQPNLKLKTETRLAMENSKTPAAATAKMSSPTKVGLEKKMVEKSSLTMNVGETQKITQMMKAKKTPMKTVSNANLMAKAFSEVKSLPRKKSGVRSPTTLDNAQQFFACLQAWAPTIRDSVESSSATNEQVQSI